MSGSSRGRGPASACRWVFVLALVAGANRTARAADIETRDFAVTVAGKPAGEVHMTIHKHDDGKIVVGCDTDINVKMVIGSYKFVYRGQEVWQDNRLQRLTSNTDDNGKRYIVSAVREDKGVRFRVNNTKETVVKHEVWLTSYWALPDTKVRTQPLVIIDADNGKELDGKLSFVATEKLRIAGQEVQLNHYRLAGKVNADLWYDGTERLVRQEWVEQGHRTIIELTRVRRPGSN